MAGNPNYDRWETEERLNQFGLNRDNLYELDYVIEGLGLSDAGGLLLEVAAGTAYVSGYEVPLAVPDFVGLTDAATNHVFLVFAKTLGVAPPTSVTTITVSVAVNTDGSDPAAPGEFIKLGTAVTAGAAISTITEQDNRKKIHDAQLTTNIEGNHKQIERMVAHKGAALPAAAPPTEEGQLFFRTTDKKYFVYNGVAWVELAAAAAPAPPGLIAVVNGGALLIPGGTPLKAVLGMPGSVEPASLATEADARVIGIADADIPPFAPGFAASVQGVLVEAEFEPALVLTSGEEALLGVEVLTNVVTATIGEVIKQVGIIWDTTLYTGIPPLTRATILLQIEQATVVS